MIKVSYETIGEDMKRPEETTINIFDGKLFARYNIPNKAETTVNQMRNDGRHGVLFSRGMLIQLFPHKTEKEILEIVKKDIENGLYVAKQKSGKELKIINLVIKDQ